MKIPQELQFDDISTAFEAAEGMVENIPFWHEQLMATANVMREKMLALEANDRLTASGSDALGYLNYLFVCKNDTPCQFLSHVLCWLFFKPKTASDRMCRTLAEGIIELSGFSMTFSK